MSYPIITIPVVFRVVQSSGKLLVKDGYIRCVTLFHTVLFLDTNLFLSPAQVAQQIRVLNQDFARANIKFRIEAMRHVINARWFNGVGYMNPYVSSVLMGDKEP